MKDKEGFPSPRAWGPSLLCSPSSPDPRMQWKWAAVTLVTLLLVASCKDLSQGQAGPFSPSASPTQTHNGLQTAGSWLGPGAVGAGGNAGSLPDRASKASNCLQLLALLSCWGPD
jgi:hypothetical protein